MWKKLNFFLKIITIIVVITALRAAWLGNIETMFVCLILMLIIVLAFLKTERKGQKLCKNEVKESLKKRLENIFNGRNQIEIRLTSRIYPYYTENFYNDLGCLIFLHMLIFIQEKTKFKCYAELNVQGDLSVSIITDDNDIKTFDEFPYELFLQYFEPVK